MVPWTLLWWLWLCLNMVAIKEELFTPGIKLWCWSPNYAKPPTSTSHGLSFLMIHDIASIWSSFSHLTIFICSRFFLLPCWVFFVQRFQSQKTVSICQHVRHIQIYTDQRSNYKEIRYLPNGLNGKHPALKTGPHISKPRRKKSDSVGCTSVIIGTCV